MFSRSIFPTLTRTMPSLFINRSMTFTSTRFAAATKLKETSNPPDAAASDKAKAEPSNEPTKVYSEKIQRLVDEISRLSLVDVMDLNELLKRTLKIQDVPIVASGGGAAGPVPPAAPKKEEEEEEARPTAQSVFKVRLIKFDDAKKVPVIKQVKDVVENINLVQAKKLVESVPQVLRDNLSKADAEAMKAKIEAVGGICVIE